MINEIMEYNKKFVENKAYEPYLTSKYPDKKLAILTCMDTRLIELLPAALGLKNGDAKIIKNAGGVITHPYGSVVRSLLVAILVMQIFMVIGFSHYTPWDELGVSTVPHILYGSLLYGKVGTIWMTVISLLAVISTLNTAMFSIAVSSPHL